VKNYSVQQYQESDYANWNTFISEAKNATFLFIVTLEYHKDRFDDFSVLIYEKEKTCCFFCRLIKLRMKFFFTKACMVVCVLFENKRRKKVEETVFIFSLINMVYLKQIPTFYISIGNAGSRFSWLRKTFWKEKK
jgi:hypothetical protein